MWWHTVTHGRRSEGGNKRMESVTSKRHITAERKLARAVQTLQADVHSSPARSGLNWRPYRFKCTRPFRRTTKSGFCACAITFQTHSNTWHSCGNGQCHTFGISEGNSNTWHYCVLRWHHICIKLPYKCPVLARASKQSHFVYQYSVQTYEVCK